MNRKTDDQRGVEKNLDVTLKWKERRKEKENIKVELIERLTFSFSLPAFLNILNTPEFVSNSLGDKSNDFRLVA